MVEFLLPPFATERALKNVKNLMSQSTPTVFIASYPKSGTTWMQSLVYHILSDKLPLDHISNFSPFVETDGTWDDNETGQVKNTYQQTQELLGWRAFNTHLMPEMLPESDNFKFIYVIRNGKDVAVSFYHHLSNQLGDGGFNQSDEVTFTRYFEDWCKGKVIYGSWLYHLQVWIEQGTQHHKNVLFVKYEDLKKDLSGEIQRINSFLLPSSQLLTNERINEICSTCSFKTMKDNLHKYQPTSVVWKEGFKFLRKGEIGDNISLLTAQDNENYETMIRNRFPGGSIPEWLINLDIA